MSDPRVWALIPIVGRDYLEAMIRGTDTDLNSWMARILAAADAVDAAAHIYRVDTRDEATIDRFRREIVEHDPAGWMSRETARAVLAALAPEADQGGGS